MNISLLSIVVPAFNEQSTIKKIVQKVIEVDLTNEIKKEIIIVNDCSTDNTQLEIEALISGDDSNSIRLINNIKNLGKGASIHKGISEASGEIIIIQDADLEYDPSDYNTLLIPILRHNADVVYGSRFMGGKPHRILFFWHSIGNNFLTFISNACTNLNLTDMETCYKMFRSSIIKSIRLEEKRFGFEPEVTAKVSKIPGIKIYEVGISYHGRSYLEGKKIGWRDGFRAIYCILKYNFLRN
jgi:glycosyltransferase involved in cell wall biosynthesis